jgi:hypothetical protein
MIKWQKSGCQPVLNHVLIHCQQADAINFKQETVVYLQHFHNCQLQSYTISNLKNLDNIKISIM